MVTTKVVELCGVAIREGLKEKLRPLIKKKNFSSIDNRVKCNKTVFYVVTVPYRMGSTKGTLALCYNKRKAIDLKEEMVRLYFDKDIVEKAFRCLKGITQLRPIRHWLYNRVTAHVMICYLSYVLLIVLNQYLKKLDMSPEKALEHLDSMYKVYMKDTRKKFKISLIVTLNKIQKDILRAVDKKLIKN